MFLSEVAHRSFWVKLSGLISELRIREHSTYRFIFGLFLKLRKSSFQGPVARSPISASPRVKINPGLFFFCSKHFFG